MELPLTPPSPDSDPVQYVVYGSLDVGHTPTIIIGIITDNSSNDTFYIICDDYERIYFTTTSLLLYLDQD